VVRVTAQEQYEQQYEYQPRTWLPTPANAQGRIAWLARAARQGTRGIVEIRPHSDTARRRGAVQLVNRRNDPRWASHDPWLVTYVALDSSGRPVVRGRPQQLRVWAQHYPGGRAGDVFDLGHVQLPATMPFPRVDLPGFFGSAVEEPIRAHLTALLATRGRQVDRATGGATPGPDLTWQEIAEMYAELAQELRNPFLAELANELAAA
jgi:hypothetical protein